MTHSRPALPSVTMAVTIAMSSLVLALAIAGGPAHAAAHDPVTVHVFYDNDIHFDQEAPQRLATDRVAAEENGRVIIRTLDIERPAFPVRVVAEVRVRPIPQDDSSVHDKWDRAGDVRLIQPGRPDIEIVKFITSYGGASDYRVDVTHLLPLLDGACTFRGFVDTWLSPAWKMDFSLVFEPLAASDAPDWIEGILFEPDVTAAMLADGPLTVSVSVPDDAQRVVLHYLVSGHCTDGRGADEFETKVNVISVDGVEVERLRPWRDDCIRFRADNPYCRRWSDGSWSSDYSRSGWCPGDKVDPIAIDLTAYLTPGRHVIAFHIEDVRPENEAGHQGYWRISSHLLGWRQD